MWLAVVAHEAQLECRTWVNYDIDEFASRNAVFVFVFVLNPTTKKYFRIWGKLVDFLLFDLNLLNLSYTIGYERKKRISFKNCPLSVKFLRVVMKNYRWRVSRTALLMLVSSLNNSNSIRSYSNKQK